MSSANNRARINYFVDLLIALAFVLAGISGLILFFAGSGGGYQGGRNPRYARDSLFLARSAWKGLHDWSGIAMLVGVFLHLVLHGKWIACMTRNLLAPRRVKDTAKSCPVES